VSRLAHEQHATGCIDEVVPDRLSKDVGRDPCHAVGVLLRHDTREPVADAFRAAERLRVVVRPALQVDAPMSGKRHEEHVAMANSWVFVVKDALQRQRLNGILGNVHDHEGV
jgi:hypothetical protein